MTFLIISRRWNTCSDGSVIPEHGERCSKSTRARYFSGIESKYKIESKYGLRSNLTAPNFKNFFLGEHAPRPPKWVRAYVPSSVPPPNRKYLPPPMLYLERLRQILYNLKVVLGKVTRYSVRETRNWDRYHFPVFVLVRRSQTRVQSARVWLHANIAFCIAGMYVNVDYIMPNKFSNSCSGSL